MVSGINGYSSYCPAGLDLPYLPGNGGCFTSPDFEIDKKQNKVSFGEGVGAFFKGLVKPLTNIIKHPIKSALMIGATAALIIGTGGAAVPFLVTAGVALGGYQIAKGGYKALTAETKAEKLNAWEDVGEGTFTVGASLAGAKAYAKTTPGGSMVTKNLAAVGKDASFGTKATAAIKGLGSDTLTTMKAAPKSVQETATMMMSGEFTGNLRSAAMTAKLAGEYHDVAKIRKEHGRLSPEYRTAQAEYMQHRAAAEAKISEISDKVLNRYAKLEAKSPYYTERGLEFCDRGLVEAGGYRNMKSYLNVFNNKPGVNIAMGLSGQVNMEPDSIQTFNQIAPAYGIDLFPELNFNSFPTPPIGLNYAA